MAKASQVVIMEGEYYIIKSPNGKVLEVKDFNTENGAGIQLWSYAGHPWQQWQFVDAGAAGCGLGQGGQRRLLLFYTPLSAGIPEKHLAGKGLSMADRFRDKGAGKSNLHRNNGL